MKFLEGYFAGGGDDGAGGAGTMTEEARQKATEVVMAEPPHYQPRTAAEIEELGRELLRTIVHKD